MENKLNKSQSGLFSNFYKKVGIGIMILAFIPAIVFKILNIEFVQTQKLIFKMITMNSFILGLFIVAWSRDKIEDEMTIFIRLKAIAFAFIWGVIMVIIKPLMDLAFQDPIENYSGQYIIGSMLFVYIIMYYYMKKKR